MRLGDGDLAAARSLFRQAEELVRRELDGPGGRGWLARAGVLVCAGRGTTSPPPSTGRVRPTTPSGDRSARPGSISPRDGSRRPPRRSGRAEPRCARHQVVRDLLLARAVADVDHEAAAKAVETAVDLAAEHGMLQTVAADGGAVLDLVELAAWRVPSAWMDRLRRALDARPGTRHSRAPGLVEELTSRERDVMRLLPSRLTLREIASELFVSQNTLKFHLRRDLPQARRELARGGGRDRPAAAAPGPGLGRGRRRKTFSSWRSNSSADSTPRSTRRSSARSWSTRRTARAAAGSTGTASSTGRRRSRSTWRRREEATRFTTVPSPARSRRRSGGTARAGVAGSARRR